MGGKRCAVVTGANKGIGFHCVEQLHAELDHSYDVVLTSVGTTTLEAGFQSSHTVCTLAEPHPVLVIVDQVPYFFSSIASVRHMRDTDPHDLLP